MGKLICIGGGDNVSKLLLVIDVQKDFINKHTEGTLYKIEELVNSNQFKNIVFTKFINDKESIWYKKLNYYGCMSNDGQRIPINTKVINKRTYSALNEDLKEYIKTNNIDQIYLCGFDTDACIYKTALDLFENGYEVYVLQDYCMAHKGKVLHDIMIQNLKRLIGKEYII